MSIKRLSTGSISSTTPKNSKVWEQETFPGTFESIASATVDASGASSIDFTNIPQTYTHLQIRAIARTSTASTGQDDLSINFNSDYGNNYFWHRTGGNGTGTIVGAASALISANQLQELVARDGQSANVFSAFIIDILDYANTNKNKIVRCLGGDDNNGSGAILFDSALWINTATISSIALGSNFKQYSHFSLYGIRR